MTEKKKPQSRSFVMRQYEQNCKRDISDALEAFSKLQTLMKSYGLLDGTDESEAVICQMFDRNHYVKIIEHSFSNAGLPEIVWRRMADEKINEIKSGKFLYEYDIIRGELKIHSGVRAASLSASDIVYSDGRYELKDGRMQEILDAVSRVECSEAQSRAFDLICDILPDVRELSGQGVNVGKVLQVFGMPHILEGWQTGFLEFDENEVLRQIAASTI